MARAAAGIAAILLFALLALALFPWGWVAPLAARQLSKGIGRAVTIGGGERLDLLSLSPVVRLTDLRIAQPAWAGAGDMLRIQRLIVRFRSLPLLLGRFEPVELDVEGAQALLLRTASRRANWEDRTQGERKGSNQLAHLRRLRIAGSRIELRDARRRLRLAAALSADQQTGVRLSGAGSLLDRPVRIWATGAPLIGRAPDAPYPFRGVVRAPTVTLAAAGAMDHPLDFGRFRARIQTRGDDLADLDRLIEAGLPSTQSFDMSAIVRHDAPDWRIERLQGRLGRSPLRASATIRRRAGRSLIDVRVEADAFDFSDLASDAALARAAAKRRAVGPRVIPDTRIDLSRLSRTDGTLRFSTPRLLGLGTSPFRSLDATFTLDHRRLTIQPLKAGLVHGTVSGTAVVDHRRGDPRLDLDLRLAGARLEDILTRPDEARGPLVGRFRLSGSGLTLRAALSRARGSVALVARGGVMNRKLATLAAGDVLRGAFTDGDWETPIRCLIGRFQGGDGKLRPNPALIDTAVMRASGSGLVDLDGETIALDLSARSKRPDLIQSEVPIRVRGTLSAPKLVVTPPAATMGKRGFFGKVGAFLSTIRTRGDAGRAVPAADADCARLAATALR